mmetsp:Transcript_67680/g.220322  ORF Transcript_67680/g.220322 Transcript_67680/m.220322 type:complete len:200 (-) Transcript_67680:396-995(-)
MSGLNGIPGDAIRAADDCNDLDEGQTLQIHLHVLRGDILCFASFAFLGRRRQRAAGTDRVHHAHGQTQEDFAVCDAVVRLLQRHRLHIHLKGPRLEFVFDVADAVDANQRLQQGLFPHLADAEHQLHAARSRRGHDADVAKHNSERPLEGPGEALVYEVQKHGIEQQTPERLSCKEKDNFVAVVEVRVGNTVTDRHHGL